MANSKLNSNENILVKVDQNNVILVDPNSVIEGGNVAMRNVQAENLVMYVNLEADLIPRSILSVSGNQQTTGNLLSIAKGTFNVLRNANGGDLDTSWTDSFVGQDTVITKDGQKTTIAANTADTSAQSFGIESININVKGASFIPQVNINFVDVRGKTLFESPENSPYKAFFHLPWPIFYLTVKGYFGKAIRYRLHLTKFTSKYNGSNGNFDISTTFVGSTYAFLNDIPLTGILNAPYMYAIEQDKEAQYNPNTQQYTKTVSKSSKGYTLLKSVYSDYVSRGLLPKSFLNNPKTLREIISVAKSLDKILEREILDQKVDFHIFDGVKEFERIIQEFLTAVEAWGQAHLSNDFVTDNETKLTYLAKTEKNTLDNVKNPKNSKTLESIITNFKTKLTKTAIFTEYKLNESGANFKQQTFNFVNGIQNIDFYIDVKNSNYVIKHRTLIEQILEIQKSFVTQRNKLQDFVEKEMNKVIKDPKKGIGFEPTIRNIFGVIMANADVYIKLLKEVHNKAYDVGNKRKGILKNYSDETPKDDHIYPWPEIKKIDSDAKQKVIAYPGDPDLQVALQSNSSLLWPEVDFVENYHGTATKRIDPLAEKEGGIGVINYVFESNSPDVDILTITDAFDIATTIPYGDKSISSIIYEIYERGRYATLLDTYDNNVIQELANNEFDNISKIFKEDSDIVDVLRTITDTTKLKEYVLSFSPFERYPYFEDKLPTTGYLKNLESSSFQIEQYGQSLKAQKNSSYDSLSKNLTKYTPEDYRKSIYPFNSNLYIDYLNKSEFNLDDLNVKNFLTVNTKEGLISTPIDSLMWVKEKHTDNLFNQNLNILNKGSINILNTPYFHKQLFSDFNSSNSYGKYVGSAYLLLNSLPFLDLDDNVKNYFAPSGILLSTPNKTRMSSLFREVNASHYVPYHLILKWGSIYHRYKTYINDNKDILSGFLTTGNTTTSISGRTFFDNGNDYVFTTSDNLAESDFISYDTQDFLLDINDPSLTLEVLGNKYVGIHPFYDAIFHQIVNGYTHYTVTSGETSFFNNVKSGAINITKKFVGDNLIYTTNYVKNSVIVSGDSFYTLLPSSGDNSLSNLTNKSISDFTFSQKEQFGFKIIWQDELLTTDFSGKTFANYSQYNRSYISGVPKTYDNQYSISSDYRKVVDLIATFSPSILDEFENCFLDFATEKINDEIPYHKFEPYSGTSGMHLVTYDKFQDLLKEVVTLPIETNDPTDSVSSLNVLKTKQKNKLENITKKILSTDNLIKISIGNSKEIIPHTWYGFANIDKYNSLKYDSYNAYLQSGYTTPINLYVGEDIDGNYLKFFSINNIELSEENVLLFRPLIYIFAGGYKEGKFKDKQGFQNYLKTILDKASNRLELYLNRLTSQLPSLPQTNADNKQLTIFSGYQDTALKLEEYNYFKVFNDKWVAGNSLGARPLMEEFLFLDKANKDIGDVAFLSLDKLISLEDPKNDKTNLYSVISMLIQGTGFDMRALPAYVNFYGTNFSTKSKTIPSKKIAQNLFGTFLDVDYQESSPKIIIQYVGPTSKHLEMDDIKQKENKFKNDSGNLFQNAQSPLIVNVLNNTNAGDLYKSNKVVAFEVSVGDENQAMFKSVELNQSSQRETSESMQALENLGRSESGAGVGQMDTGLFDIYRLRAYTCEVTMLGNVMIQPTMFFYLKNIPMFRGSYWITDVTHNIKPGNITTIFKGTRIPYQSLPNPKDSFYSSYRVLFDKIQKAATARVKEQSLITNGPNKNEQILQSDNGSFLIDTGDVKKAPKGEEVLKTSGANEFGVGWGGFNGEKYIVKVKNPQVSKNANQTYFRAVSCVMGGKSYVPLDDVEMAILSRVTSKTKNSGDVNHKNILWNDIKNDNEHYFYAIKFDLRVSSNFIISAKTTFTNPSNGKSITVSPIAENITEINQSNISGAIHKGPASEGFGIALSKKLMRDLGLNDGDVIYFNMDKGY
jgi:hypothetical protein